MTRTLILGGARSGKSAHAETLAIASGKQLVYIATAQPHDEEMTARIQHHRAGRDAQWMTLEEPIALGAAIAQYSTANTLVLVDCLTVWLSNLLFSEAHDFPEIGLIQPSPALAHERASFLQALKQAEGDLILVSNEVGQGVVPQGAVSRWFVDEAGRLNQAVAAECEQAFLIVAGLPLKLKG
jgi:adenosylcobinamide kinase/adenosylcobinamide-phosphate guanylyltransferase